MKNLGTIENDRFVALLMSAADIKFHLTGYLFDDENGDNTNNDTISLVSHMDSDSEDGNDIYIVVERTEATSDKAIFFEGFTAAEQYYLQRVKECADIMRDVKEMQDSESAEDFLSEMK